MAARHGSRRTLFSKRLHDKLDKYLGSPTHTHTHTQRSRTAGLPPHHHYRSRVVATRVRVRRQSHTVRSEDTRVFALGLIGVSGPRVTEKKTVIRREKPDTRFVITILLLLKVAYLYTHVGRPFLRRGHFRFASGFS